MEAATNFDTALAALVQRELKNHRQIIFNGNGYSDEWQEAAAQRGLMNLRTTPDALAHYTDSKNVKLLARHGICTATEVASRKEILLEEYCKTLHIEALTMLEMIAREILPACISYSSKVSGSVAVKASIGVEARTEKQLVSQLTVWIDALSDRRDALQAAVDGVPANDWAARSAYYRDSVIPAMDAAREAADQLETMVGQSDWPFPTYGQMLFYV